MPAHVAVLFDGEHENSRTALDAGYKANRADDLIAGYALTCGQENEIIISSFDSDFFQLITAQASGFTMGLRRMRGKQVRKMSLRAPVFAQFSAGALNFYSKMMRKRGWRSGNG